MSDPVEQHLAAAGTEPWRYGPSASHQVPPARLAENLAMVHAELDAPRESRLARLLRRMRVPDLTIPLVTATPALRRSWLGAVTLAILFALGAAANATGGDAERLQFFLTIAPLVPLAGVALAFGRGVDPSHDVVVAAPRDTFRVFLVRAATVLCTSVAILVVAALLLPHDGPLRFAWLLPALAITTATMALSIGRDARRVAALLATAWVVVVVAVTSSTSATTMFGPVAQLGSLVVLAAAVVVLYARRGAIEAEAAS